MVQRKIRINEIPALLWGNDAERLFIAIHGDQGHKQDGIISAFADVAVKKGCQMLSFDLPEHGDRKDAEYPCKVQNSVSDLKEVFQYAGTCSDSIGVFGCSIGAYFSLVAYQEISLSQCLFLSPVMDMQCLIETMMSWAQVSAEELEEKQEVETPRGKTLYWDYYCYVRDHPIRQWLTPTSVLYGENDDISEFKVVSAFCRKFGCDLEVLQNAEHFFHMEEQLHQFRNWLKRKIKPVNG